MTKEPDIYIVGLGINGAQHVTREAVAAIQRSTEVLALPTDNGLLKYLAGLCPLVTELHSVSYEEGHNRIEAYDKMSQMVISSALDAPPATFALYGHPLVYVSPSRQIIDAAPYLDLAVDVLPGISSLDTMFIDLQLDPAVDGLQMYEATDVLLRERPLQCDVPCLLWQVGAVETSLYSTAASRPSRFERIKDHLLKYYPADHNLTAVYSTHHPLLRSSLLTFALSDLESRHSDLHQGLTIYIPPVAPRPATNLGLIAEVESPEFLRTLIEEPAFP